MTNTQRKKQEYLRHLIALQHITGVKNILEASTLADNLGKIERKLHKLAENECNGVIEEGKAEKIWNKAKELKELIPGLQGLTLNGDPRGYALKIDDEIMRTVYADSGLQRDFGGYGILAPDF